MIALTSPDKRYDTAFLSNYALLNIQDALARIPGVGLVRIFGARDYSMRIWLDPEQDGAPGRHGERRRGGPGAERRSRPRAASACRRPPGTADAVHGDRARAAYRCRRSTRTSSCANAGNGQIVRLKDVARVELGGADYRHQRSATRGPAALHRHFPAAGCQRARCCQACQNTMDDLAHAFPPGMVYSVPYTTTPFVTESLKEVVKTLRHRDSCWW